MHAESPIGYTSPPIPGKEHRGMQHESRAFSYLFFKTKLIQHGTEVERNSDRPSQLTFV